MSDQPNVLFMMADQLHAGYLGVAGHPTVQTPNLDQLAESGVRFTRAYVQNPICTPSRVCFLSGQYAHNTGYYGLSGTPPTWLPNLFAHVKAHGYTTGAVGKIHTPEGWIEPYLDFLRETYDYDERFSGSHYAEYLSGAGLSGERDDEYLQEWLLEGGEGQGLDARPSRLPYARSVDRWTAGQAERFLRHRPTDRPFFLWVSIPRPHPVWTPSQEFWDMYPEETLVLPPNAGDDLHDKPPHMQQTGREQREPKGMWVIEPRDWEHGRVRVLRGYLGCVSQVDRAAGDVLAVLDELKLRDNTIVVFCSDHGDFAGEHGIIEKAPGVGYEAITRVPFIWSWPGHIRGGHVVDELVESIDFFPTVCQLAGLPAPRMCDGSNLSGLLGGDGTALRDACFTEHVWTKRLRTARWSFVHYQPEMFPDATEDVGELYDMEADPWELTNLYHDARYQEVVHTLRRRVLNWMIGTQHPVTIHPMPTEIKQFDGAGSKRRLPEDGRITPEDIVRAVRAGLTRNYL